MSDFIEDARPKAADAMEGKAAGDAAMEDSMTEELGLTPQQKADLSDTIRIDPVSDEDGDVQARNPPTD